MFYMLLLVPLIPNDIALFVTLVGLAPRFLDLSTVFPVLEARSRTQDALCPVPSLLVLGNADSCNTIGETS